MGLAILLGFIVFFVLNGIFGLFIPVCVDIGGIATAMGMPAMGVPVQPVCISIIEVSSALNSLGGMGIGGPPNMAGMNMDLMLLGILVGSAALGLGPLFTSALAVNIVGVLLPIIAALIAGVIAGVISRGAASRGFVSGFSSVIVGYYIALVIVALYVFLAVGGAGQASGVDLLNLLGVGWLLGVVLITPIIVGIIGGMGGALMSAILASPIPASQPVATTTNIIQAPAPASAPVIIQGGGTSATGTAQPAQAQTTTATTTAQQVSQIKCPACGTLNDSGTTFCQSCGTRLRS